MKQPIQVEHIDQAILEQAEFDGAVISAQEQMKNSGILGMLKCLYQNEADRNQEGQKND